MDVYFALAEPKRRQIIEQIALNGQLAASEIAEKFQVTASAISQHLKVLCEANILKRKKKAQQRLYSINTESLVEVEQWVTDMKTMWEERFDNLEKYLNNA